MEIPKGEGEPYRAQTACFLKNKFNNQQFLEKSNIYLIY